MRAPRSTSRALGTLLILFAAAVTACGADTTTEVSALNVAGVYTLKTVDGVALPAPAKDDRGVVGGTVLSGTATLTDAKTFTHAGTVRLTNGTTQTDQGAGTYTISGNTITFQEPGDQPIVATFSGGNTLTFTENTQVRVYQK
jgi:hypothetical protein